VLWPSRGCNPVRFFLEKRRSNIKNAREFLAEIGAEIIGYELGFFGDFELFLKLVWKHLLRIEPGQHNSIDLWNYLVRTFCVELYDRRFCEQKSSTVLNDDSFNNTDLLFENFLAHIDKVKKIIGDPGIRQTKELDRAFAYAPAMAAANSDYFKDLLPFMKSIKKVDSKGKEKYGRGFRPDKKQLFDLQTIRAVSKIIDDEAVFWEKIEFPEALLYNYYSRVQEFNFPKSIALLISLWNTSL
jgi:hypothetical protein